MNTSLYDFAGEFSISKKEDMIDADYQMEHYHNQYEICLFIKADLDVFIKNTQYKITDNDTIIINPYEIHKFIYKNGTHYVRYVINFSLSFVKPLLSACNLLEDFDILTSMDIRRQSLGTINKTIVSGYLKIIHDCYRSTEPSNANQALLKANFLLLIIELINLSKVQYSDKESSKPSIIVNNIISYIEDNYTKSITLDHLEQQFHFNKFYISKIFKKLTGFTIIDFIQHRRIIEAQKMITEQGISVTDACYRIGFNNIQHFYKVFKRITKKTPYAFSKQYKKLK